MVERNLFTGYSVGELSPMSVSHLQFADDTLLMGTKSWANVRAMRAVLVLFENMSGLRVNFHKSLLVGVNIPASWLGEAASIDMDTIEVSNLNRQFLFRQSHVRQSKDKVARDAVLKFRPKINITSYHENVKDPDFNVDFFTQFNVVLNGLDYLDARRHVNRLCLAADVPLVDGTTGFLGQVI
ncbi:unnamed protein product [Trifolium pratense]|uniref:Uncharacterized protein n=1 Tax=Trifolium pratense TaxID=57577 RepID=A0ACB0LDK7_TRIPR|nr:unnamed protein product [Trifolium pratense]